MICFILILNFYGASRLILRNTDDRDFELTIPKDIKFNVAYVYNNNVNKVTDTGQKNFALEISRDEDKGEIFYFSMPERTKPNLYYGVCLTDQNGIEHFSNRYYCATNDEFYTDKSSAPKKKRSYDKPGFLSRMNWKGLGFIILVAALVGCLVSIGYIAFEKYKKRRDLMFVDSSGENRPVRFK